MTKRRNLLGLECLETRVNLSASVYSQAALVSSFNPAELLRTSRPSYEVSGGGVTISAHPPGGRPGETVILQVIVHSTGQGTALPGQSVVFNINGSQLKATTDGSGYAQVSYKIPTSSPVGHTISFTVQAHGLTAHSYVTVHH